MEKLFVAAGWWKPIHNSQSHDDSWDIAVAPPEHRFWAYAKSTRQLLFFNAVTFTGGDRDDQGQMEFGKTTAGIEVLLTLNDADRLPVYSPTPDP